MAAAAVVVVVGVDAVAEGMRWTRSGREWRGRHASLLRRECEFHSLEDSSRWWSSAKWASVAAWMEWVTWSVWLAECCLVDLRASRVGRCLSFWAEVRGLHRYS